MQVLLLHNPTAGAEHPTRLALIQAFEGTGHTVVYRSSKDDEWADALGTSVDVIVVAGGDGTIRKVATTLAALPTRRSVPLALLPVGTANNIARTFGVRGSLVQLAAGLHRAYQTRVAVGIARWPWGEERFVESAGVGIFAEMLRSGESGSKERRREQDVPERIDDGLSRLQRALNRARPLRLQIEADGEDLSGEYLFAEAVNIESIGPCVDLAPGADYSGDTLDLVLMGAARREALAQYFEGLGDCARSVAPVVPRRARRVTLRSTHFCRCCCSAPTEPRPQSQRVGSGFPPGFHSGRGPSARMRTAFAAASITRVMCW